jgi:hypothetical protein
VSGSGSEIVRTSFFERNPRKEILQRPSSTAVEDIGILLDNTLTGMLYGTELGRFKYESWIIFFDADGRVVDQQPTPWQEIEILWQQPIEWKSYVL